MPRRTSAVRTPGQAVMKTSSKIQSHEYKNFREIRMARAERAVAPKQKTIWETNDYYSLM